MAGQESESEKSKRVALSEDGARLAKRTVRASTLSIFLSVFQHISNVMSEPVLFRELYNGDLAKTTALLGNTQAIIGILGIVINQIGGKLSDSIGRRNFFLVGPIANVFNGLLVACYPRNMTVLVLSRIFKKVLTSFSSTIMVTAALYDTLSVRPPDEGAVASSRIQGAVGAAIFVGPMIEAQVLKWSNNNLRSPYLLLAFEGALHAIINYFYMPETLPAEKRAPLNLKNILSAVNPFGFVNIFKSTNKALKQLTTLISLQLMLEGANASDLHQIWAKNHLNLSFSENSQFSMCYGGSTILAGLFVTPLFLKRLSVKAFTTVCNLGLAVAFGIMRASHQKLIYFAFPLLAMPGVNGASCNALQQLQGAHAAIEGYGNGEFSAWTNNLRALVGAFAPLVYGNVYAWAVKSGKHPGLAWKSAAFFGAVLPQILLLLMPNAHLELPEFPDSEKKAEVSSAAGEASVVEQPQEATGNAEREKAP